MKVLEFRLGMNFRALLSIHLGTIHELNAVNQERYAEKGHGTRGLEVRRVAPNVATHFYSAHLHYR